MTSNSTRFPSIERLHRDAVKTLVEARNYCAFKLEDEVRHLSARERLDIRGTAFLVTSRLALVVSWWASRKAVETGELASAEPLPGEDGVWRNLWRDASGGKAAAKSPRGLKGLLKKSFDLLVRTRRLERMH